MKDKIQSDSGALPEETAGQLYRCMLKIRLTELRIAEIYPSDKIQSPVHLCIGQEAVSAGVCLALGQDDHLFGTYRSHGIYIGKNGNLNKLFAELYAKDGGCCRGKGGSMHLVAPEVGLMGCSAIVGSTIPVATGDALASQMQGRTRVVIAFFGDGAVDEGVFYESLNFAVLKNLPILFICENNFYAIHSKVSDRHKQTEIYRYGEAMGLPGQRWDGNQADVVYRATRQAVQRIREGGGPQLLEYVTHRIYEHVGIAQDHQEAYRDRAELTRALTHDPLAQMKDALVSTYKLSPSLLAKWETSIRAEIDEAVNFAEKSPFPGVDQLLTNVYKDLT